MKIPTTILGFATACLLFSSYTQSKDYLKLCWEQQVKPLNDRFMSLHYHENQNFTYHSAEPWMTINSVGRGLLQCNTQIFQQSDTTGTGDKMRISRSRLDSTLYLSQAFWTKKISVKKRQIGHVYLSMRYSPIMLIELFYKRHLQADKTTDKHYAVYTEQIDNSIAKLYIRKSDGLIEKAVITEHHEIWGDVSTTYHYSRYTTYEQCALPKHVRIEKVHGIVDEIDVFAPGFSQQVDRLMDRPEDYVAKDDVKNPVAEVSKIREHIYSINLIHAETQATLIEFKDFLVIIDAAGNSENGELIIQEAKKIAPSKPVRYFAFSHHHPGYLGGIRAFIHHGSKIISTAADIPYLQFINAAAHTLKPDSLQLHPKPLLYETIDSHMTITDGILKLDIYHIGEKSAHTNDYLIFYLPTEKLVFQGDLVWIKKEGTISKAGKTQEGLYNAVKHLGLQVDTVIQSWPSDRGSEYKTSIPFSEIEQSVKMP